MGTVAGIFAIVGAVAGLVQAGAKIWKNVNQYDEDLKELGKAKDNLTDLHDLQVGNLKEANEDRNKQIDTQIAQTSAIQEQSVKQASSSIAVQNQLLAAQMAEIRIQGSQQEGQAIQNAAVSGFRGDMEGSLGAATRETNRAVSRAIKQAGLQANLNRMQSYNQALNQYTSAEYQKALYVEQQQMNTRAYLRTKAEMDKQYLQRYTDLDEAKKAMEEPGYKWMYYLGVGADVMGDLTNSGSNFLNLGEKAGWWGGSAQA